MAYDGTLKFDTSLDTSGFQSGASGLGEIAKNALSVFTGNLMTSAVNKVGELGEMALRSGSEFEASMAKASTLFSGTEQEFANLSKEILNLSSSSGLAARGLAEAAYSAESASVPAEQLGAMLDKSSKLAAAGFTDIDTALSATAKTMNAYGMEGEEAMGKVQKVLMQTQNLGITTVGELGASLAQVTPTAAAFGVSFDQVGASLAVMTAQGTSTAQATTQLNSLIAELGKEGTTASKNLQKAAEGTEYAGMSFAQMMESGADLGTVLGMISDQADKDGVSMVDMFSSIEAGKAALSIFSQEGETFKKDLGEMATSADVVGDAYAKVSDTLEFKTQQMQTSLQNLATVAQQAVAQDMKNAMDVGVNAVQRMQTALQEGGFKGLAQEALKIGGELITQLASGIMDGMPKVTEAAVGILHSLSEGIRSKLPDLIPVAMNALVTFTGSLRSNVGKMVDAGLELITALADSLIANIPVFVRTVPTIVTNIAGLINDNAPKILSCGVQIIGKLVGGIISALPVIAQNIPQIIQAIVSVLMAFNWLNLGKQIITFIGNGIKALTTTIPKLFSEFCKNASSIVSNFGWASLGRGVIQLIVNGITGLISAIPNLLGNICTGAIELVKGIDWFGVGMFLVEGLISGISGLASAAVEAIKGVGQSILDGFKSLFGIASPSTVMEEQGNFLIQGLTNALTNLPSAIGECLSGALSTVVQWGTDLAQNGLKAAGDFLSNISGKISEVPGAVGGFLSTAYSNVTSWGSNTVSKAKETASNTLSNVKSNFSQIPGQIGTQLNSAFNNVNSWGTKTVSDIQTNTTNALNTVKTNFTSMTTQIGTQLTAALTKVTTWSTNTLSNIKTSTTNVLNTVNTNFTAMTTQIGNQLTSALTKVTTWSNETVSNLKDSTTKALNSVKTNFTAMTTQIGSQLTTSLSKVTTWGSNTHSKVESSTTNAVNAAKSAFSQLPPGMQKHLTTCANKVTAWGNQLANNGRAAAVACKNAVTGALSSLPGQIVSVGENIASGLARGIRNGIGWVTDAAWDIARRALNAAKSALGISSPSKVFEREVGKFIPPGIGRGITRAMPKMERETEQELQDMAERMRNVVDEEMAGKASTVRLRSGFYDEPGEGGAGSGGNVYQTININQPVKTPSETARAIRLEQQYGLAGD